jgi:hypothetical protein
VHLINHDKTIIIHLCINSPLHHIYINYSPCINDNSLIHLHQCIISMIHIYQLVSTWTSIILIKGIISMIHLYQLVSTWTSIILIKGIISMIHLYKLVSTWTYIILINASTLFINHQSINYLTSINDINQTKPFASMTYDPTISQIIKPLASMTT